MQNKKTKILFLIHTLQVGGAEKVLVNLVNNMDPEKFDITVMTVIDTGAFRETLNNNIKYKTIIAFPYKREKEDNKSSGNLLSGKSVIKSTLAKLYQAAWRRVNIDRIYKKNIAERYDVEVAFLEGIATKIIAHSDNKNSKKIAWVHIDLLKEKKSEKFYNSLVEEKDVYNKFDEVVAVSELSRQSFIKKYNYNPNKVVVRYNPIDVREIREKADIPVKKDGFTVCTVGRLSRQKGFLRLLEVTKELRDEGIEFVLWVIGVGEEERALKKYIEGNSLDNVKMLGYKENPYPYIKHADLYVCSSITEGLSTTVSEAIVLETPIVATDCSGMKELLGDSKYGMVCENSKDGIKKALKDAILDKKLYNRYVENVKRRSNFFDMDKTIKEITELFRQ